ncbi:MAG TPA: biopolymer transporter ExbD [Chthoniobacterales bacterium]
MRVASPLPHKKARIEIIPLIDIMFFLLASFMMVSLSQVHMKGIRINLPSIKAVAQPTPPPNQKDYTSLFVDADGVVHFDQQTVPDDMVPARLLALYKANPNAKVFISADKEALHGDVVKILDRARQAGITHIGYEIKVKAGPSHAPGAAPAPPPGP